MACEKMLQIKVVVFKKLYKFYIKHFLIGIIFFLINIKNADFFFIKITSNLLFYFPIDEKLDYLKEDIKELKEYERLKKETDTIKTIVLNRKLEKLEKNLEDWKQKGNENQKEENNVMNDFHTLEEKEQELINFMKNVKDSLKKLEKIKKKFM